MTSPNLIGPSALRRGLVLVALLISTLAIAAPAPAAAEDPNPGRLFTDRGAWPLYRQWTQAELRHYARWIEHLYDAKADGTPEQRAARFTQMLSDPAMNLLEDPAFAGTPSNPQLPEQTLLVAHRIIDCGKLATALAGYYAYRRGLPWMVSRVVSGDGEDIRRSAFNRAVGQASCLDYPSAHAFFADMVQGFCTGNYRVNPNGPGSEGSDTVPVAIRPDCLMPGSLFYFDGHVMVMAKVGEVGELHFLEATTAPSRDIRVDYGLHPLSGIQPAGPPGEENRYAGCYRGFRIYRFPVIEINAEGRVTALRRMSDEEMRALGYSLEQYDVMRELTTTGAIRENGLELTSFESFIRERMRPRTPVDPLRVLERCADDLLRHVAAREEIVQAGWSDVQTNGPIAFPDAMRTVNIFNDRGRWGRYATSGFDADLRGRYAHAVAMAEEIVRVFGRTPGALDLRALGRQGLWSPADLAFRIAREKRRIFRERTIEIRSAEGAVVTLSLLDIESRLYDLSFDPNHPPEWRWGRVHLAADKALPTPLPSGRSVEPRETFQREAFYRTLPLRELEESYLAGMFTSGFAKPDRLDVRMGRFWDDYQSPPLVPADPQMAQFDPVAPESAEVASAS